MPLLSQAYAFNGVNRDLPGQVLQGQWSEVQNMQFRRGFGTRVKGDEAVFSTTEGTLNGPDYVVNVFDGTNNFWLYGATDGVGVTDGATHKVITPTVFSAPADSDHWTGGVLNGVPFLNYQQDIGAWWGQDFATPTVMAPLTDGVRCKALRPYRFGLVAMDTSEDSAHATVSQTAVTVAWSAFADPGAIPTSWTPSASNNAGFIELASDGGACVDGGQFRNSFLIGKSNGFWVMDFVGGQDIMSFRQLFSTGGLLSRNCMAEVDGSMFALTDSDFIVTDGNSVRSVIDNVNRKHLFSQLGDNFQQSFIVYNEPAREIWVCTPVGSDALALKAHILDVDTLAFGERDFVTPGIAHAAMGLNDVSTAGAWNTITGTWATIDRIWNQGAAQTASDVLIWADGVSGGQLYQADGETDTLTGRLERYTLDFGAPGQSKTLLRVWPRIEAEAAISVSLSVGTQDSPDEAITWGAFRTMTTASQNKIDYLASARYLSFRFTSSQEYALTGFDAEYRVAGRF